MKVEQYRPAFVTGFKQKKKHFKNAKQLLSIKWINKISKYDGFHQFSLCRDKSPDNIQHLLMAEYNNGDYFVVAYIQDKDISGIIELPEWKDISKKKI